jgi:hypothetical protein
MEATPGIEIHENRHPKSRLASNSHFITQLQLPTLPLLFYFVLEGSMNKSNLVTSWRCD